MKNCNRHWKSGFTLMEIMVASTISIIVLASFMAVFIHGLQLWQQEEIKNELHFNLEEATEKIRQDLRLSSIGIGLMAFYSATGGDYNAISIPISTDTDGDGLMERDDDDKLIWNQTVIYHVRPGTPDKLMRTVFAPRNTNATTAQIYAQLQSVVSATSDAGVATCAMTGETCTSKVVFENLVQLVFRAPTATYDCYSATTNKGDSFTWGSLILSSGTHTVTFAVTNKNTSSTGYDLIIDSMSLSASASPRDGELFYPVQSHPENTTYFTCTGTLGTISASYMGPEWNGQSALIFTGVTNGGGQISFSIENDVWVDNNFNSPSYITASNCSLNINTNYQPTDVVVSSDKGVAWGASDCGTAMVATRMTNLVSVTNYIWGNTNSSALGFLWNGTNSPDGLLKKTGRWAKFYFTRGTNPVEYSLFITNVQFKSENGGFSTNITFNGGNSYLMMYPESSETTNSDWMEMLDIEKGSNYMVSFQTKTIYNMPLSMYYGERSGSYQIRSTINQGTLYVPSFPSTNTLTNAIYALPQLSFADADGDGDYDMFNGGGNVYIFTNGYTYSYGGMHWFRNAGTSRAPDFQYAGRAATFCSCTEAKMCVGDIDGDGDVDLVAAHPTDSSLTLVRNTGTRRSPSWSTTSTLVSGIVGQYPAPALVDIDGDSTLDLFCGTGTNGNLYYWHNGGTVYSPSFSLVTTNYLTNAPSMARIIPSFADLNSDGLVDLIIGGGDGTANAPDNGKILYYKNIGTTAAAVWDMPVLLATANGNMSSPAFVEINGPAGAQGNGVARWQNSGGSVFSAMDGVTNSCVFGLSSIEVGYPKYAIFQSGVFDTCQPSPSYTKVVWTKGTNIGCTVDVRVRSSAYEDMSVNSGWQPSDTTYYTHHDESNSLTSLSGRYVQYEARLECGTGTNKTAHTNATPPILRDVTIGWRPAPGLVDLQVTFGRGPNCGIVDVKVDGQTLVKALEGEMKIYKAGRTGTNYATGILEVRPLNTGK